MFYKNAYLLTCSCLKDSTILIQFLLLSSAGINWMIIIISSETPEQFLIFTIVLLEKFSFLFEKSKMHCYLQSGLCQSYADYLGYANILHMYLYMHLNNGRSLYPLKNPLVLLLGMFIPKLFYIMLKIMVYDYT